MLLASFLTTLPSPEPAGLPQRALDAQRLLEQPLAALDDTCETNDGAKVRRVRSATLDGGGEVEDRIELVTTTRGADRVTGYAVNDVVLFTARPAEAPDVTAAGLALLGDESPQGSARTVKLLAAFAAMQARVFAADVDAPQQACGATEGKADEQAKCALIGVVGCVPPAAAFTCGVSALIAVGCTWLVEKVCEAEPETCQPGWTEG